MTNRKTYLLLLAIVALALGLRLVFLSELRAQSYLGNTRISDAYTYHQEARRFLAGPSNEGRAFWQAPLYPFCVSLFYRVFGDRLVSAQLFHVLLGALVCLVLFFVGRTIFDSRVGLLTALLAALYAPFWLFDVQQLPASLTILFYLLEFLLIARQLRTGRPLVLMLAGLVHGACIITHGMAIFATPAIVYVLYRFNARVGTDHALGKVAAVSIYLGLLILPPLGVCVRNSLVEKEFMFLSSNAGINLFIGNHPDYSELINLRNGLEWDTLFVEWKETIVPGLEEGQSQAASLNRFFAEQAVANAFAHPLATFRTELQKTVLSLSGAEISRNFPIYPLREQSLLLRVLLWQLSIGGWVLLAFPTGLVLPAAFAGLWAGLKDHRVDSTDVALRLLPALMAVCHVLGMILIFPCTRYRAPAMALMLPYTAYSIEALIGAVKRRGAAEVTDAPRGGFSPRALLLFAVGFAVCNLLGPAVSPLDPVKQQAEHILDQGYWFVDQYQSRKIAAESLRNRAVALEERTMPSDPEVLAMKGKSSALREEATAFLERAIAQLERARQIDPTYTQPLSYLGKLYFFGKQDAAKALEYCLELTQVVPELAVVKEECQRYREAISLQGSGESREFPHGREEKLRFTR